MRRKLLASLLTLCLVVGLLPTTALATEDGAGSGTPVACTQGEGCEADSHDEGCPLYATQVEPVDDTGELTDPVGIEFSNASSPYSGNYFISTKESLEALSTAVNSGNTMQGIKFYLQNDIILNDGHFSAKEGSLYYTPDQSDTAYLVNIENATYGDSEQLTAFVPIGFQAKIGDAQWQKNGFAGEFYGNNHEIKGLFVNGNHANAEAHYKGLFGALLTGGNISDLAVSGCVYGAGSNSGGIVGKSWGCIDNCHFSGVVMGAFNAGGIVGETASTGAANTLQNCTNTAHISEGSTAIDGGGNWGGIAGCANGVSIQNCINYGAVASSKYANVGGIIGVGNADISACINWGSITGPESRTTNGGVAGTHNTGTTEQNFICITTTDELTKYTRTTCPNHAKWAVALYLNGGSFDGGIVVSSGALATPTKENQIFDGWYVNSDLSGEAAATLETEKIYYAKWIPDSGSCGAEGNGENVTWKLEQNNDDANNPTYTITFAGTGGMADYDPNAQPWFAVKNSITEAVVEDGVTRIGQRALQTAANLRKLTLRGDVTIGDRAFQESKLTSIFGQEHIVEIEGRAFKWLDMETIDIRNATAIGTFAFEDSKLKTVTLGEGLKVIGNQAFVNGNMCKLYIPDGTQLEEKALWGMGQNDVVVRLPSDLTTIPNGALGFEGMIYVDNTTVAKLITKETHPLTHPSVAVLNSGAVDFSKDLPTNAFADPTREGSIFGGWYDNENCTGEAVTTAPTAGQTYYAKWTGIEPLTLEYTRTEQLKVTNVTGLTNWRSSDTTVATVDESGNVTAVGVGTATISATGTYNEQAQTFTTTVTVTPLPITFGTDEGENPNGRITYTRASKAPEFSQFATFYPAQVENDSVSVVEGSSPITLTQGTDITFEYDAGGGKATYNYLPLYVTGTEGVEVTVRLINGNYCFVTGSNSTPSNTITAMVVVTAAGKTETEITGLPNVDANSSYEYTGVGIAPVTDLTGIRAEGIDSFTVHFHRWGDTVFPPQHLENKSASELTQTAIQAIAPREPGSYLMILDGVSDSKYGHQSWIFTIEKGTPEGEPTFEKASSGVVLSTVTLSGEMKNAAGTAVAGSFAWENGDQTVERGKSYTWIFTPSDSNYNTATGTAVVWSASSGGGSGSSSNNTTTKTVTNADGSVTTTVTNKTTGTVTETTKYKDGSTLVVETKKDGTVTTTETRTDGVRVKTVDAPEKDVTVSVTIPKSVGTTTILGRTEAGYGMVAVDAETGKVVKLSVPTEDGLLVKLDGSAELTLVNNAREFSDTNGHWAENAIDFATAHEMFAGTSETTFSPDDTMTRAMLMTVLARFNGEDTAGGSVWYEKGMAWAVANGVSDGSYPEDSISREQLATMLWRYAGSPTVSGMALSEFSDHDSVSGYAADAMRWAVSEGLIVGVEHDVLAPRSTATRAQVATILMRFVEMLTK